MRESFTWRRILIAAAAGALLCLAAGLVAYKAEPGLRLDFFADEALLDQYLTGFYDPERGATHDDRVAWTKAAASLHIADLDRTVPWSVSFRLTGGRPAQADSLIEVAIDRIHVATLPLPANWEDISVRIDPRPDARRGLQLDVRATRPFAPGNNDPRLLGILLSSLSIEPASSSHGWPPPSACLALAGIGAITGLLLMTAGFSLRLIGAVVTALALVIAALMHEPGGIHGGFLLTILPTTAILACGAIALSVLARVRGDEWSARAWSLTGLLVIARVMFLLHPGMTSGDTGFHLHRLEFVRAGNYFFTSAAPGGEFPYPIAMYVIASWFAPLVHDWITFLRIGVAVVDGFACYAVFSLMRRGSLAPQIAVLAMLMYYAAPAVFQIQAIAYLPNGFGQAVALTGFALLVRAGGSRTAAVASCALFLVAFLSHLSTFMITLAILIATAIAWRINADPAARRLGARTLVIAATATALAIGLFYAHFPSTYKDLVSRLIAPAAATTSTAAPVPIQRKEAHQTQYVPGRVALGNRLAAIPGYVNKYLTWPLVILSLVGAAHSLRAGPKQPMPLRPLLLVWGVVCFGFLVVGQFTPLDFRYYLAVIPALAMLGAFAVSAEWKTSIWRRSVATGLAGAFFASGLYYWFAWFGRILPR